MRPQTDSPPKWNVALRDSDPRSIRIQIVGGSSRHPKDKIEFRPAGVEFPKKFKSRLDPKANVTKREDWQENENANVGQVGHDVPRDLSEAIARGYPRVENSGLPLAMAAETC